MRSKRNARLKNVYVVKSSRAELDRLQKKEKTETKRLYVLKESEEAVVKYQDVIYDFVDEMGGLFYVISQDRSFFQNLSNALNKELALEPEFLRMASSVQQAAKEIEVFCAHGKRPFIFLEHVLRGASTLQYLQHVKAELTQCPVIILSYEVRKGTLSQYHESGADSFITKPASVNILIEKIAFTLAPQTLLEALIREGKQALEDNDFEAAVGKARDILKMKPNSAVGFMILGDALKGLKRREEALRAYQSAEQNADMYIEPLKRILEFHREDGNETGRLEYLVKLDKLSPLDLERKLEVAGLLVDKGEAGRAEAYIDSCIEMAGGARGSKISMDYAERLMNVDPVLSEKYFRGAILSGKRAKALLKPLMYNRLGLALRKQGRWRDAVSEYEEAEALAPSDENIQFNMAMALAEGKQWAQAAERVDKALTINPGFNQGNAIVSYHVGTIYKLAKQGAKALGFFRHVQELDPAYKDTAKQVERLAKLHPDA